MKNLILLEEACKKIISQNLSLNMKAFRSKFRYSVDQESLKIPCGSTGCLLGWCPFLGIKEFELIECDLGVLMVDWHSYAKRVFGRTPTSGECGEWDFVFSPHWDSCSIQNLRRVQYLRKYDLPKFNFLWKLDENLNVIEGR